MFSEICSSSVTFPMEFFAHICNGPATPAGILAFGSFLDDRLSIKPQVIDGRSGGMDGLRAQGRAKEEGEFPRTENFCPFQCLYLPWTVCTVKYSRFVGSVPVEWLFPSLCRTDFLREGHPAQIHPSSSHGCEVTSDLAKPKLPVWALYLDYKHSSASNLPFAS